MANQRRTFSEEFKREAVALVVSETGMKGGYIHVMCTGDSSFEVKLSAGEYIGDKVIRDNVLYRVDKNEPVKTTMSPTSKRMVYMNDTDSQFLKDIMNGSDSVIVRLTSYDYDKSKAKFTLIGSTDAIRKVLAACSGAK